MYILCKFQDFWCTVYDLVEGAIMSSEDADADELPDPNENDDSAVSGMNFH